MLQGQSKDYRDTTRKSQPQEGAKINLTSQYSAA